MWDRILDRMLRAFVRTGALEIDYPDGTRRRYGPGEDPIRLKLADETLVRRLCLNTEVTVGEAYMDGTLTIEGDDLRGFLDLATRNRAIAGEPWWLRGIERLRAAFWFLRQFNRAGRAKSNVAHHYDLSGELYDLFLDEDRQYSCAYFPTGTETLDEAQRAKKLHIARKLLIEPGMRVLDIGCGWGGMAITLARDFGARVVGVTLSEEQVKIARDRVAAAGLSDLVEIRLADYRDLVERFDRIVSVGMFEHVGAPQFRTYFRKVRDLLTEDGVALIHTIGRSAPPQDTGGWITKYIFPGGYIPSMSDASAAIEKEGLWLADIEVWRLHYAETLRNWYERFQAREDEARALYDERFCRMWRYYLAGCEMTFRNGRQGVFQFQLAKKVDAVPITRDYLYRAPEEAAAGRPESLAAE